MAWTYPSLHLPAGSRALHSAAFSCPGNVSGGHTHVPEMRVPAAGGSLAWAGRAHLCCSWLSAPVVRDWWLSHPNIAAALQWYGWRRGMRALAGSSNSSDISQLVSK